MNPDGGKAAVQSRTIWSLIGTGVAFLLPLLLKHFNIVDAAQQPYLTAAQDVLTVAGLIAAGAFRANSTVPVTSVLPKG